MTAIVERIRGRAFATRLRERTFSTLLNIAVSVLGIAVIAWVAWSLFSWGVVNAVWTSSNGAEGCRGATGACWAVIEARWRVILFGLYPYDEQWRSVLGGVAIVIVSVLSCLPLFWTARRLAALWLVGFSIFYGLMRGGVFGLGVVPEANWGGLSLTIFIFVATVLLGMPMAIMLALLRRSTMPVISSAAALVIDSVRSLPLLSILFTAAVIVPFLMPQGMSGDKLYRVVIGCAIFFAAYQAEVIRSGMQAVGRGQEEAAKALGLSYWHHVGYILMPQAFRYALPPTISQIVIAFKETSLVVIVGFFELMASANAAYGTGEWRFAYVEVYVFVAMLYFVFIFSLSRYGAYLERSMRVGKI
jgi:general L-amino acid transport system permease protein